MLYSSQEINQAVLEAYKSLKPLTKGDANFRSTENFGILNNRRCIWQFLYEQGHFTYGISLTLFNGILQFYYGEPKEISLSDIKSCIEERLKSEKIIL